MNTPHTALSLHFCLPLLLACAASPGLSATEFEDSVPVDLVKLFLGNPGIGEPVIYSDIMDEFPPFTVPPGFEVLGSLDQIYNQRVVLRTDLDEEAARTTLTDSFLAEGWQIFAIPGMVMNPGGFISANQPPVPLQLCHEMHGMLQVGISTSAGGRLVNLNRNAAATGLGFFRDPIDARQPCDPQQLGRFGPGGPAGMGLMEYMPRLVMPEAAGGQFPTARVMGSGGSGDDYESRASIGTDLPRDELYAHFAAQLAEQGWMPDSENDGSFLFTGSWLKVEGDVELLGILNVVEKASNNYDMEFRLIRKGGTNPAARVMNRSAIGVRPQ